jgi:hypothetical protein
MKRSVSCWFLFSVLSVNEILFLFMKDTTNSMSTGISGRATMMDDSCTAFTAPVASRPTANRPSKIPSGLPGIRR